MVAFVTYLVIFAVISSAIAYDPDMLQDLCVANTSGGLVHFQKNNGGKEASVIAAFNSQLPGTQSIAMTLFTSTPEVPDNVLTKAFQVGTKEIHKIKTKLAPKKS
ncbi:hypothetical protein OIU78_015464 [Salix suchowensis]|nr:hypothetical protein OIU78_015464 [Salix suchowensis]